MPSGWLSTGKAARVCSVNPDTVLKWIKKGRLPATRTAGGHYRIEEGDLAALIPTLTAAGDMSAPASGNDRRLLRCWEYLSNSGTLRDECKNCVVYQIRAAWCFQVANLACDIGRLKSSCNTRCEDCVYYRRVSGQATNVLVVTADGALVEVLAQVQYESIALRLARTAYDASASISSFRPAFVVVDWDFVVHSAPDLIDCLMADPRLPGVRVILAVPKGRLTRAGASQERGIVSVIEKPFGQDRIVEVIDRFPVEALLII